MLKRMLIILAVLIGTTVCFCCAAGEEPAESVLSSMILWEEEGIVLIPQPDGTAQLHRLRPDAYVHEQIAFLMEMDWRTVRSYDPQTETIIYRDGSAINAYYPWRRWHNVQRCISREPMVILTTEGTLTAADNGVDVPAWTDLKDAWYISGSRYDEVTNSAVPWQGFVGMTAKGTMLSTGLPEEMAQEIAGWRNISKVYQHGSMVLAVDQKGRVYAASMEDTGLSGDVSELFGGVGVKEILLDDIPVSLKKDGTVVLVTGEMPEDYVKQIYIEENYEAVKTWENVAEVRILHIDTDEGEYTALAGLTRDGKVLADGIAAVSDAWAELLSLTLTEADAMQAYEPEEYLRRASYRTGLAISTRYAAMIDKYGTLCSIGTVNGTSMNHLPDKWSDLVSIAGAYAHVIGLRADGTAVAEGLNSSGQCEVGSWWNITEVAVGDLFSVGLTEYGMIAYAGTLQHSAERARYWNNVIAIDACDEHVVGLRADGTALSTAAETGIGSSEVLNWTHLVDIAAGEKNRVAGILLDGSVIATRNVSFCRPEDFVNLTDIVFSGDVLYGLRRDGTVVASGEAEAAQVAQWTDVVQLDGSGGVLLGRRADGSLLWAGWSAYGDEEIPEALAGWHFDGADGDEEAFFYDIYAVHNMVYDDALQMVNTAAPAAAGDGFVVAILRNGTLFMTEGAPGSLKAAAQDFDGVVRTVNAYGRQVLVTFTDGRRFLYTDEGVQLLEDAVRIALGGGHLLSVRPLEEKWHHVLYASGANGDGQCDLQGVAAVTDVAAGDRHSVAVIGGRYLAAAGDNSYGQCNVGYWENPVQLAAGGRHTLGLMQDGSVLAAGENTHGQCNVSDWAGKVKMLAAGDRFSAGMTAEGRVLLAGEVTSSLRQALSWEQIVFISANADHLVGVNAFGKLYSTAQDVTAAEKIYTAELDIPRDILFAAVSLDMAYNTLDVGAYGCIALCEDGSVIRNEIRHNPNYDSVEDYGEYYAEYAVGEKLALADKPVAMVCAVRGGAVLYEDGTVQAGSDFPEAAQWTDVVMISGYDDMLGALTRNGKVYLSGNVSAEVAEKVAAWPPVRCLEVVDRHVTGANMEGYIITTNPSRRINNYVWYDIVKFADGVGVRSDGTTTADSEDGRRVMAQRSAGNKWLTVYADGSTSFEIPDMAFPIVQMQVFGDCFILQQQDGSLLLYGGKGEVLQDVHRWKVALPRGVEKLQAEEEALTDGVTGAASFRTYRRMEIMDDCLRVVLPDGRVLQKFADKWEQNAKTRKWEVVETRQAMVDTTVWYDIVEVMGELGLRKDGRVVTCDFRGNATVVEGFSNVRKLVARGNGGITAEGVYLPLYQSENALAAAAWTDLVDVQYVGVGVVGLRSDGTLVTHGLDDTLAGTLARWRNVTEIVAYKSGWDSHLAGLTTAGEVLMTGAVPGEESTVTKPVRHIMGDFFSRDVYVLYQDGTLGNATYSYINLYGADNSDLVDFVCDGYCGVGLKSDGWMVYSVTYDSAASGFYPNYDEWSINTININTLEGVIVQ